MMLSVARRPGALALVLAGSLAVLPASAGASEPFPPAALAPADGASWRWPVEGFRLVRGFEAPAHEYGPGHRGIDVAPSDDLVRAPAHGVVAFAGQVAGRGVLTIDHGGGLVSTLEPVRASVAAGETVTRGETVGTLGEGGHSAPGTMHFGVRRHGVYINPLLLLGGVPRAVLLPCC